MDLKSLLIVTVFLFPTVCLTNTQDFDCLGREYNIALVYDCRYSIQVQEDFFKQFLYQFKPLGYYINILMMTYGRSNLLTFEKFTKENFTLDKINDVAFKLNTSSCPQHLSLKTLLNDTRGALSRASGSVRKLAVFVMAENLTEFGNDNVSMSLGLVSEEELNVDVKRVFILVRPVLVLEVKSRTIIYTRTLNNSVESVYKIIRSICCYDEYSDARNMRSCYDTWYVKDELSSEEAALECKLKSPGSGFKYFNSKIEYEHFTSIWREKLDNNTLKCLETVRLHDDCNTTLVNGKQVRTFNVFIGLSIRRSNISEEYIWSFGFPLVFEPPWGSSNEGQGCVYMSQKNYYMGDTITRGQIEWNEIDCNKRKRIAFILCESEIIGIEHMSLNLSDLKPKKQEPYVQLLHTSYSHLLFKYIKNESQSNATSLIKQKLKYNVIEKECKIKWQKCKDSNKSHITSKCIEPINESYLSILSRLHSCELKQINCHPFQFSGHNHTGHLLKNNETTSKLLNSSSLGIKYLRDPGTTVANCLYEIDSDRRRVGFPNMTHLQDCKQLICPPGFIKCHNSYCIPVYLVYDGVKDCPFGEDEFFISYQTKLCAGKLKFTLTNICLQQEMFNSKGQSINSTNDFVCQVPCDTGYVCVSNIVRKDTGSGTTFHISFVETTVHIYEYMDSFTFTPQIYSLFEMFKLVEADLNNCRIRDLNKVIKSLDNSDVTVLDASINSISGHSFSVIQEMKHLIKLNFSFNNYLELDENFIFPLHLQVLDLSHTKCGSGVIKNLVNLTCLKILELRNVDPIDLSLTGNVQLDILDVRGTELINIKDGYLSRLSIQTALYSDDFRICCPVIRGPNITEDKCHAPRDAISTCNDLIGDPQKRAILWVVGILSLLGNMVVVIYRIVWDRAVFNKAYGLFVVCLGVSDFIMGVYLIIIAGADLFYRNMYVVGDSDWRYSDICKLAGILSTFSSETSTMFICLITLDRYLVIKYPFGQHRFSKTGKITSLCLTLIIGVVVSVIPVLFPSWEIHSSNGMCLALPFSSGRHRGWEYSAILFVGLNFFLFILIAIGQLAIFLAITSYKHDSFCGTRDDLRKAQDMSIAKQLFCVALSDFCCWFPIGIMGIMSLNGFQFYHDVYAWSAVLILPVNSAINPLIYTLPTILKEIKSRHVVSKTTSRSS